MCRDRSRSILSPGEGEAIASEKTPMQWHRISIEKFDTDFGCGIIAKSVYTKHVTERFYYVVKFGHACHAAADGAMRRSIGGIGQDRRRG